jgi:deoxyribose-phosphate aldolase
MVRYIGALISGNGDIAYHDICAVLEACNDGSKTSKIIIEAAPLPEDAKVHTCTLAKKARTNNV